MSKFRSRYKTPLLVLLFIITIFFPGLPIFIGLTSLKKNIEQSIPFEDWNFTILIPLLLLAFLGFTINFFIKNYFKVIITENEIIIGKRKIKIDEIEKIVIREKAISTFLIYSSLYEATALYLKNGEKINIGVENYANGNLIQHNLEQINNHIHDQTKPIKILDTEPEELKKEEIIDYSTGVEYMWSPYLSISNYLFTGVILFIFWAVLRVKPFNSTSLFFLFFIVPFCYFILVVQNHYFILTNNHLIVKNTFLPIKNKIFNLDEIEIIETENAPKQETALKITTKKFKIYRFQSGLMNEELFSALIKDVYYNINNYSSHLNLH